MAVDGPSGSGKSSVSRQVAARYGLSYLDTGAMYRAVTLWCLRQGIALEDAAAVAEAARRVPLVMGTDPQAPSVLLDGVDVGEEVRDSAISAQVSQVATNLAVRERLIDLQREYIARGAAGAGIVAEGRDITTVVAPQAEVRVLLVASEAARLRRRSLQLHGQAGDGMVEQVRDEVVRRDRDDATVAEFTEAAPGVVVVDTSELTFEESVAAVEALLPLR
ncbi:Cytidylate kinase [Austwickia sp. TVS 96-490-7B]|nr:Cytidylate kinase [Austwickia sp. TVS 96-490-7B]